MNGDQNWHEGDVLIMVCDSMVALHHTDLETNYELLWLQLHTFNKIINLAVYYRPPNISARNLHEFNSTLSSTSSNLPIVLCGDFNLHEINWHTTTPSTNSSLADSLCLVICDNF